METKNKRNVLLWALYDFANSFTQITFLLYFSQWIVVEQGISDLRFNLAFVLAATLLLAVIPFVGVLLDGGMRRITGLRVATLAMIALYASTAMAAVMAHGYLALALYTLGLFSFLLTFTFYTPLLADIASPHEQGKVSGWGIAANFLGQIAGLVLALPFSLGTFSLFGSSFRAETLLPAVMVFAVLALPMLLWFSESYIKTSFVPKKIFDWKRLWVATKKLFLAPGIALFLVSHFLFYDAILTASNNFSLFLENVWSVSDLVKTYILLGILATSALGGVVAGMLADRFGHKKVFIVVVGGWIIILPLLALLQQFTLFVITTTALGFWYGASWALSRTMLSYLAPKESYNLAFGYFGVLERTSALLGPLVWGLVATGMVSYGGDRYRFSMITMTVFVVGAFALLSRVQSDAQK